MFTKHFKRLNYRDTAIAGGKGASLGEMAQSGFPIPPGFVVLADAFDRFLEETDIDVEIDAILKKIKFKDIHSVDEASITIRDIIADTKFPADIGQEIRAGFSKLKSPAVAVRSSATAEDSSVASWAGELESYLNINEKNLLESVKKCWSSLFTPRAIFYRYEKNLSDQHVAVAVVVQKMIQSDVSGICFTAHPVTNDRKQIVLEAGFGLGEAIVGGLITPDTYVIKKNKNKDKSNYFEILDKNISNQAMKIVYSSKGTRQTKVLAKDQEKQKITDAQILRIAEICQNIEDHYRKPQDIEWAIEKGKIYITQSRPITTL